ncbi:hypothetical protein EXIGLDRAFT_737245 [Exidia glandulosa HHB12029]|uniref:Uncharacterized protein n=1 Tax=Exidia glandulosa HHB12029 TaxID=1314781 RepID=A0A165J2K7_EXIGL|nr:hypothetical protein EXIGLDRAFT_737245 [Exidia glandulosa HHB12029]
MPSTFTLRYNTYTVDVPFPFSFDACCETAVAKFGFDSSTDIALYHVFDEARQLSFPLSLDSWTDLERTTAPYLIDIRLANEPKAIPPSPDVVHIGFCLSWDLGPGISLRVSLDDEVEPVLVNAVPKGRMCSSTDSEGFFVKHRDRRVLPGETVRAVGTVTGDIDFVLYSSKCSRWSAIRIMTSHHSPPSRCLVAIPRDARPVRLRLTQPPLEGMFASPGRENDPMSNFA